MVIKRKLIVLGVASVKCSEIWFYTAEGGGGGGGELLNSLKVANVGHQLIQLNFPKIETRFLNDFALN